MVEHLIIDCDPGVDDAVALLAAFGSPEIALMAITTVAGNVPLHRTSANARRICEAAGRTDIPVFAGCDHPLQFPERTGAIAHGTDGLGGVALPDPIVPPQGQHAVSYLIDTLTKAPNKVTLAILGPMTNIATALTLEPAIADRIARIVVMGGAAFCPGNMTPHAEFNFWFDPHAAQIVMAAGVPLVMVGLDVTRKMVITADRRGGISRAGRLGSLLAEMLTAYAAVDPLLHDPCVIAYLLRPDLFTTVQATCSIELQSLDRIGQSLATPTDIRATGGITVVTDVATDSVFHWLEDRLRSQP